MVKFLYSSSLESHMDDYMKNVKLKQLNNDYQIAQDQIVREGEAMQVSQAEIMNKIKQMQETLKGNIAGKLIPRSQTDAPELPKAKKEEYKPMTASEYENKISKKPTITISKKIPVPQQKTLIDELKEKLQKRKQTQMITEVFPEVNKRDVNKLLSDIIKKGIKKQDVLKTAEAVVDDIITQASRRNITKNYVDDMINKAVGSASSQATTASSSTTTASNIQDIKQTQGSWMTEKHRFNRSEKYKTLPPEIRAELKLPSITQRRFNQIISEFGGEGIKKKRGKK